MANMTSLGEKYWLRVAQGALAAQYTTGYDRVGLYDDDGVLIGSVQNITWGWSVGKGNIFMNQDPLFNIPAGTTVKGAALFCSGVRSVTVAAEVENPSYTDIEFSTTGDLDMSDALAIYPLETPKTFPNAGTTELSSLTYNFEIRTL